MPGEPSVQPHDRELPRIVAATYLWTKLLELSELGRKVVILTSDVGRSVSRSVELSSR